MRPVLALLLALSIATAAPLPFPKPTESDLKTLQGEWEVVSTYSKSRSGDNVTVRVNGGRISFLIDGELRTTWAFTLNPAASPKAMDLRLVESKINAGVTNLLEAYHVERGTFLLASGWDRRASGLDPKKPEVWEYVCKRKR